MVDFCLLVALIIADLNSNLDKGDNLFACQREKGHMFDPLLRS